jgi:glycogen synthase
MFCRIWGDICFTHFAHLSALPLGNISVIIRLMHADRWHCGLLTGSLNRVVRSINVSLVS